MPFPAYIGEKSLAGEGPDRGLQAERKQWSVTRVLTCLRLNELAMLKVICFLVLERSALSPLRERDCHPLRMASTLSGEKLLTGRNREWAPEGKAKREGRQLPTAALLPTCLTCGHCHHAHPTAAATLRMPHSLPSLGSSKAALLVSHVKNIPHGNLCGHPNELASYILKRKGR